ELAFFACRKVSEGGGMKIAPCRSMEGGATGREERRHTPRRREDRAGLEVPDLKAKLARARREARDAADEREASAEILRAISGSAGDVQPVFQAILDHVIRICGG